MKKLTLLLALLVVASSAHALKYVNGTLVIEQDFTKCAVIEDLAAADDNMSLGMFEQAVVIEKVGCSYVGVGTTAASISLEDGSGNAMTHTAPTCTAHGSAATFQSVTAGGSLTAGEILRFDVDNAVDPETDDYTICYSYTLDY